MDEQMTLGVGESQKYYTAREMAEFCDCTVQWIYDLRNQGILVESPQGWHIDNFRKFTLYQKKQNASTAKDRRIEIQTKRDEFRLAVEMKEYVLIRDVEKFILPLLLDVGKQLASLPNTHAPSWFKASSEIELMKRAQRDIDSVLEEVSRLPITLIPKLTGEDDQDECTFT